MFVFTALWKELMVTSYRLYYEDISEAGTPCDYDEIIATMEPITYEVSIIA